MPDDTQEHRLYKEADIRDKVFIEVHGDDFDFVDHEREYFKFLNSIHCVCGETFHKEENAVAHLEEVTE